MKLFGKVKNFFVNLLIKRKLIKIQIAKFFEYNYNHFDSAVVRFLGTGHQTIPLSKILFKSKFELLSGLRAGRFRLAKTGTPS